MSGERTTVVLEKVRALSGVAPLGMRITFGFPAGTPIAEARRRAYRNLQRVHPDENTMCWQVESTEAGS